MGPNGTRIAYCHFRARNSLDFQGPPLPVALVMDVARIKHHSFIASPQKWQLQRRTKVNFSSDLFHGCYVGEICGRGANTGRPFLLFYDLTRCAKLSAVTGCSTPQVQSCWCSLTHTCRLLMFQCFCEGLIRYEEKISLQMNEPSPINLPLYATFHPIPSK